MAYINPITVSITLGLVLGIGLFVSLWKGHGTLKTIITWVKERFFTRIAFFWTVNIVFMAVSVLHAGSFFGITGKGHDLPGIAQYLGFAVSFFLDLVTIVLMQAQLEARYRGEDERARQFILFIAICCSTSTFANLAISLNDFNAQTDLPHAPSLIQMASPYVLASFPLFVILMSIAAEMIVNIRPMDKLNEATFEEDEKKRIKMLEIRNTYLEKQATEEQKLLMIRAQQRANKAMREGKPARSFRWPWEAPLDLPVLASEVAKVMQAHYDEQTQKALQGIRQQVLVVENELRVSVEEMKNVLALQMEQLSQVQQLDYVKIAEQIVPFLPPPVQPDYERLAQQIATIEETIGDLSSSVSFLENETSGKIYPDLDETEDETFDGGDEDLDETERHTDPNQIAVPGSETNGADNITFLHSTVKPKRETRARTKKGSKTAAQKAAAIIKNNPDITPAELMKKVKMSPQYARRLLSQQASVSETV